MRSTDMPKRGYRMTNRATHVDRTRDRIVEAAVHLHGTVGPARTTVAAIAEAAGVTRLTVYRHFPDAESLFAACTAHWTSRQQLPDIEAWLTVRDPRGRLRIGLSDLYRFYAEAAPMLTRTARDWDELPDSVRALTIERQRRSVDALLTAWPRRQRTTTRTALVGHAVSFTTWRSLCLDQHLSNRVAVAAMVKLIC